MLSGEEQKELLGYVVKNAACPANVNGELQAFRQGLVTAVNVLAGFVSRDKGQAEQPEQQEQVQKVMQPKQTKQVNK